jgi:hypothetical protein
MIRAYLPAWSGRPCHFPTQQYANGKNPSRQVKCRGQASCFVLDYSSQLRHEKRQPPSEEDKAVVRTEVLGPEEVGRERRQEGEAASVLPVGDSKDKEKQWDVLLSRKRCDPHNALTRSAMATGFQTDVELSDGFS